LRVPQGTKLTAVKLGAVLQEPLLSFVLFVKNYNPVTHRIAQAFAL
jgi:hypothetical protein